MARSPGTRARTIMVAMALGGHAGHPNPYLPPIASRRSPRSKRKAVGGEAMDGDAIKSSLRGGRHPAAAVAMFP